MHAQTTQLIQEFLRLFCEQLGLSSDTRFVYAALKLVLNVLSEYAVRAQQLR